MSKYLGLDLGSVTCGVSASETGLIAHTVETIRFKNAVFILFKNSVFKILFKGE